MRSTANATQSIVPEREPKTLAPATCKIVIAMSVTAPHFSGWPPRPRAIRMVASRRMRNAYCMRFPSISFASFVKPRMEVPRLRHWRDPSARWRVWA